MCRVVATRLVLLDVSMGHIPAIEVCTVTTLCGPTDPREIERDSLTPACLCHVEVASGTYPFSHGLPCARRQQGDAAMSNGG